MTSDIAYEALLQKLEQDGALHDATESEHRRKRLNLEPDTARLIQLLILSGRRRRVLEIGTSNGYSALWLANSLRRIPDARPLISIEREPEKVDQARHNLARAGMEQWVDLRVGDATEIVRSLPGPFDAVFFDADRISAPAQLDILLPKLQDDALLLADNALSHPDEISAYLEAVRNLPGFTSWIAPVGKGLSIAHRLSKEQISGACRTLNPNPPSTEMTHVESTPNRSTRSPARRSRQPPDERAPHLHPDPQPARAPAPHHA